MPRIKFKIMIKKKYAWFPKKVYTWRQRTSKAIIWLQSYYEKDGHEYCLRLGKLSYEL